MYLSEPSKKSIFRGSQRRSCLHWSILVPFQIFWIFKKAHFGHYFRLKTIFLFPAVVPGASLTRPWRKLLPKWSQDAPRLDFHGFWTDVRWIFVRFVWIFAPIRTHRDHVYQHVHTFEPNERAPHM